MLVVMALGGNAILQRGQPLEAHIQRENIRLAAKSIAEVAKDHQVVLTHGNGPQVGLLALMNEAYEEVNNYPLDVLGAQTQGMIGFMFEQELRNHMPGQKVCTVSTQTIVDPTDHAFQNPDKFVGPVYTYEEAQVIQQANPNWVLKEDGKYYRRVVPSPQPKEVLELPSLRHIVASGDITVICGGGGGIPVRRDSEGKLHGIEAVVDKDHASRCLAEGLEADGLVLLTDITAVETDYGSPDSRKIKLCTPQKIKDFHFAAGSMSPKVESVCHFVRAGGKFGGIGPLNRATDILKGVSGTLIKLDVPGGITYYD
ncbi:carbamate kinase [Sansalvadorimonas sp. 2012CJ34-2]|uniref:Carbamate kinase n=1 Tax=Parendozoicomonas callyspongiae TaxID=2942213 RepID=A0ABT0PJ95_9GAMM|nr:carbamate kinase [Sansalvadorimonas sp. 2012CJ34-2]MCL6271046.1 carbamate kinase [Sansalvadorimonas sp. 2012CJ34-2]